MKRRSETCIANRRTNKAIEWAKLRVQGGKLLMEHDGIRAQLAEMRKETGVEKLVRDAAACLHSDGVNRTMFLRAANSMFGPLPNFNPY